MIDYYYPIKLNESVVQRLQFLGSKYVEKMWDTEKFVRQTFFISLDYQNLKHDLNENLKEIGFSKIKSTCVFVRNKDDHQQIHYDTYSADKLNEMWHTSLNIPISGCVGSKMRWYNGEHEHKIGVYTSAQGGNIAYDIPDWHSDPVPIAELELTSTYMVRPDLPHAAIGNGIEPRIVVVLRLEENPPWEEMVKIYKDYESKIHK
jgi:hypothetical protein